MKATTKQMYWSFFIINNISMWLKTPYSYTDYIYIATTQNLSRMDTPVIFLFLRKNFHISFTFLDLQYVIRFEYWHGEQYINLGK